MVDPKWTLLLGGRDIDPDIRASAIWTLTNLPGPNRADIPPDTRPLIEAKHHHARVGDRFQNVLFQHDWDVLLNGRPHLVDLHRDLWFGSVAAFRTKVYREAAARHLGVKTKVRRSGPNCYAVQAYELPDSVAHTLPGHQANPPWYRSQATAEELAIALVPPVPDPEPAPATSVPADWSEDLGSCSCGADSEPGLPHAPSCSIWG